MVDLNAVHAPIRPEPGSPDRDPTTVPAEAIVEAEPDEWWTIGRRIRVGAAVASRAAATLAGTGPEYRLAGPPPPYGDFGGGFPRHTAVWRAASTATPSGATGPNSA